MTDLNYRLVNLILALEDLPARQSSESATQSAIDAARVARDFLVVRLDHLSKAHMFEAGCKYQRDLVRHIDLIERALIACQEGGPVELDLSASAEGVNSEPLLAVIWATIGLNNPDPASRQRRQINYLAAFEKLVMLIQATVEYEIHEFTAHELTEAELSPEAMKMAKELETAWDHLYSHLIKLGDDFKEQEAEEKEEPEKASLKIAIYDIDSLSQECLSQIQAIASLAMKSMENGLYQPFDIRSLYYALMTINYAASELENSINCNATDLGCNATIKSLPRHNVEVVGGAQGGPCNEQ